MRRIGTVGFVMGEHLTCAEPFVLDTRSHDIPNTIAGMIRALPAQCVALSLRLRGGTTMVRRAEREARKRGLRVLWV